MGVGGGGGKLTEIDKQKQKRVENRQEAGRQNPTDRDRLDMFDRQIRHVLQTETD